MAMALTFQFKHEFGHISRPFVGDCFEKVTHIVGPQIIVNGPDFFQFHITLFDGGRYSFPQETSV